MEVPVPPATSVRVERVRDAVGLFGPEGETEREIVPVNPLRLVIVTLDDRVSPEPMMRVEGIAIPLKSFTPIMRSTSRERPPLLPITLTV